MSDQASFLHVKCLSSKENHNPKGKPKVHTIKTPNNSDLQVVHSEK